MSDPLTIREQVIQALEIKIGAQRGVDSYDERDFPLTVLFEGPEDAAQGTHRRTTASMTVRLEHAEEGVGECKKAWLSQGNAVLGRIILAATGGENTLDGLAQDIEYTGGGVAIPEDGTNIVTAFADLRVTYRFKSGNPYEQ